MRDLPLFVTIVTASQGESVMDQSASLVLAIRMLIKAPWEYFTFGDSLGVELQANNPNPEMGYHITVIPIA